MPRKSKNLHPSKTTKPHEFKSSFPLETVAWLLPRQGHAVWSSDQLMSEERRFGELDERNLTNKGVVKFIIGCIYL